MVRKCVHQARCLLVEAFKEGNCCVAQAFNNKRDDFSIVASSVSCANFSGHVYLTPTHDAACSSVSSGALCAVNGMHLGGLRQALVHIQTKNALGRRSRPSPTHTQPFRPVRVVETSMLAGIHNVQEFGRRT